MANSAIRSPFPDAHETRDDHVRLGVKKLCQSNPSRNMVEAPLSEEGRVRQVAPRANDVVQIGMGFAPNVGQKELLSLRLDGRPFVVNYRRPSFRPGDILLIPCNDDFLAGHIAPPMVPASARACRPCVCLLISSYTQT